jgi:DNA-binding IclR family transcriptional regulator
MLGRAKRDVLKLLTTRRMTAAALAADVGLRPNHVRVVIHRLLQDGLVEPVGRLNDNCTRVYAATMAGHDVLSTPSEDGQTRNPTLGQVHIDILDSLDGTRDSRALGMTIKQVARDTRYMVGAVNRTIGTLIRWDLVEPTGNRSYTPAERRWRITQAGRASLVRFYNS